MSRYVDGFVVPVPKKNLDDYRRMAEQSAQVWKEYGALEFIECVADDVKPGKLTSFPQAVQMQPDEVVCFSWIIYASREDRDRINSQVMADPRIAGMKPENMPFDGKRMIYGGFRTLVEVMANEQVATSTILGQESQRPGSSARL